MDTTRGPAPPAAPIAVPPARRLQSLSAQLAGVRACSQVQEAPEPAYTLSEVAEHTSRSSCCERKCVF